MGCCLHRLLPCFFFPVGVNALYAALLWWNRAMICVEKDPSIDEEDKKRIIPDGTMVSFLHHPYSGKYFWWEAVDSVCASDDVKS